MPLVERRMIPIRAGMRDRVATWVDRLDTAESRSGGFPPRRWHCLCLDEVHQFILVWEREWPCFSKMEEAYARLREDQLVADIWADGCGLFYTEAMIEYVRTQ